MADNTTTQEDDGDPGDAMPVLPFPLGYTLFVSGPGEEIEPEPGEPEYYSSLTAIGEKIRGNWCFTQAGDEA